MQRHKKDCYLSIQFICTVVINIDFYTFALIEKVALKINSYSPMS